MIMGFNHIHVSRCQARHRTRLDARCLIFLLRRALGIAVAFVNGSQVRPGQWRVLSFAVLKHPSVIEFENSHAHSIRRILRALQMNDLIFERGD
jgi:hypothetical protein